MLNTVFDMIGLGEGQVKPVTTDSRFLSHILYPPYITRFYFIYYPTFSSISLSLLIFYFSPPPTPTPPPDTGQTKSCRAEAIIELETADSSVCFYAPEAHIM